MPIKDIMDLGHDPKWIENIVKRVAAQKERFYQDIATKEQSRLASQFQEKLERAREKYMPKPIYKPEVLPPKRETPRPTSEWTYTGGFGSK
jgi:hypothetical protein